MSLAVDIMPLLSSCVTNVGQVKISQQFLLAVLSVKPKSSGLNGSMVFLSLYLPYSEKDVMRKYPKTCNV